MSTFCINEVGHFTQANFTQFLGFVITSFLLVLFQLLIQLSDFIVFLFKLLSQDLYCRLFLSYFQISLPQQLQKFFLVMKCRCKLLFFSFSLILLSLSSSFQLVNFSHIFLTSLIFGINLQTSLGYLSCLFKLPHFIQQDGVIIQHSCIIRIDLHTQLVYFLCFLLPALIVEQQAIVCIPNNREWIAIKTKFIVFLCLLLFRKLIKCISQQTISLIIFWFKLSNLVEYFYCIVKLLFLETILCYQNQLINISFSAHVRSVLKSHYCIIFEL